jgi:hypothetical protein
MTEEIYIDGTLMDLDAGKTNVQLIYQSPVLTDFQSVVSNRTTNVALPLTPNNLRAIGYVGTQADSDFPYKKHTVIYKRDGIQMLTGIATLLSIKASSISFCFTWGNVKAMEALFNTSLRSLTALGRTKYPATDSDHAITLIDYGSNRKGVGVKVYDILDAIQDQCEVTGLMNLCKPHASGGQRYWLALTTRNGDTITRRYQGTYYGNFGAYNYGGADWYGWTGLKNANGGSDPHGLLNSMGVIDVSQVNLLSINLKGTFRMTKRVSTDMGHNMDLYGLKESGWTYIRNICAGSIVSQSGSDYTYEYSPNITATIDVSDYSSLVIMLHHDSLGGTGFDATISNQSMTNKYLVAEPTSDEECLYDATSDNVYPIWLNLPDISCGQFIKNLLWLRGEFAYSQNGRDFQIISFNQLQANKAQALDWTEKMTTRQPQERQTKLENTARKNYFRYAEADYYDNTRYQGVLYTQDETIEEEREYCKSDFAVCPNNKIPVWSLNDDGEMDFVGDNIPPSLIYAYTWLGFITYRGWHTELNWNKRLSDWYDQYANIIRKPVVLKAEFVLTTYDLFSLDMTIPVYLKQTGHYYLIRKLTTKSGGVADAELVKL